MDTLWRGWWNAIERYANAWWWNVTNLFQSFFDPFEWARHEALFLEYTLNSWTNLNQLHTDLAAVTTRAMITAVREIFPNTIPKKWGLRTRVVRLDHVILFASEVVVENGYRAVMTPPLWVQQYLDDLARRAKEMILFCRGMTFFDKAWKTAKIGTGTLIAFVVTIYTMFYRAFTTFGLCILLYVYWTRLGDSEEREMMLRSLWLQQKTPRQKVKLMPKGTMYRRAPGGSRP